MHSIILKLLELWRESSLIQGLMALGCIGTVSYMYATGKPVPDTLIAIVSLILGYYFGSKNTLHNLKEK